jgi:hypothetical protein
MSQSTPISQPISVDCGGVASSDHASSSPSVNRSSGPTANASEPPLRHQVATNPHSPPNFRANGPLSNVPKFATAFSCKADATMVRRGPERCEVW